MLPFLQKPFRMDALKSSLAGLASATPTATSATDLEIAMQNNWLELWYQPKIHLKSQLVCGAEALIRMRHPERGLLPPSAFLPPPADQKHKLLAHFVMRRALVDWSNLAANGVATKLAINMPISVFETQDFVGNLRRYLPKQAEFPGLIVELTEDEMIRDPDLVREVAIQLKLYNIDIAIDDFGSGYSTLERLRALPFAELKIDRKYVDGCSSDQQKYLKCQKSVTLAHQLDITVVAEGVEVLADVQSLIEMNCDIAQGFFFAKPMERDEFAKTFLSRAAGNAEKPRKKAPYESASTDLRIP
jgi:EAL domain-containing protein (putative c-di-GMP-specific phosphodiesterase class I)